MMRWAICLVAAAALTAGEALACDLPDGWDEMTAEKAIGIRAALRSDPSPVPVGEPFTVTVAVCTQEGQAIDRVAFDAIMPAHGHGMNYTPEIVRREDGRYALTGLLFHMSGRWQATFTVFAPDGAAHFTLDFQAE